MGKSMDTDNLHKNWNLGVLDFVEGGKAENAEKNHRGRERTNNKFSPRDTASTRIEPRELRSECLSTAPLFASRAPGVLSCWIKRHCACPHLEKLRTILWCPTID